MVSHKFSIGDEVTDSGERWPGPYLRSPAVRATVVDLSGEQYQGAPCVLLAVGTASLWVDERNIEITQYD